MKTPSILFALFTVLTTLGLHANPGQFDMPSAKGESSRTAYIAFLKEDSVETARKSLLPKEEHLKALAKYGITNVSFWVDKIGEKNIALCYHRIVDRHPDKAWGLAMQDPALSAWMEASSAHIITEKGKPGWVRCETLMLMTRKEARLDEIGKQRPIVSRHLALTSLKPEKEMEYRLLHQTPWQGVLENLGKCDIPIFDIFLTEIDGKLIKFYYFDYLGTDLEASFEKMAEDPVTRRWWKYTDACQTKLPGAPDGSNWRDSTQIK